MLFHRLALAAALSVSALSAHAGVIVDSLSANADPFNYSTNQGGIRFFNIAALGPLGQSFTLSGAHENLTVSAYLSTFGSSANETATLVSGLGLGGTVLGSDSFSMALTRNDAELALFDFSGLGALDGDYTVVFSGTGTLGGGTVNVNAPNNYTGVDTAGTSAWDSNGAFNFGSNPARDFGIQVSADPVSAVPLPASALFMASAGGLLALRRRKRA